MFDTIMWIFSEKTWRPPLEYDYIEKNGWPDHFPRFSHLTAAIPFALLITLIRFLLIPCFTFLCRRMISLPSIPSIITPIPPYVKNTFALFYSIQSKKDRKAKKTKMDPIQRKKESKQDWELLVNQLKSNNPLLKESDISLWYRAYKIDATNQGKIKKFNEAAWLFLFYLAIWIYGFQLLIKKQYFYDTKYCWYDYLKQEITDDMHYYYFLSLGHYLHLLIAQFFDVKRKDFVEMFIHHIVTIFLLSFSYVINFVRIGTLVLFVHDGSDILLQLAKIFNYAGYQRLTDTTFVFFAISFGFLRLYAFPSWVLYSTMIECMPIMGPFFNAWWSFNALLWCLQILHIFWFITIVRMALSFLRSGEVKKDDRSESENEEAYDIIDENSNNNNNNTQQEKEPKKNK